MAKAKIVASGIHPKDLVKRDIYGRVRHAWAREARVVNCDPDHCKGVWKPPPDILVNRTPGTSMAAAQAKARNNPVNREDIKGCEKIGKQHMVYLKQLQELGQRKIDEPRPATVPAMNVKQPFHVQQYFDRAADHGVLAIGKSMHPLVQTASE